MHSNKLISASSPYLLQHAYNPVNWQEWSEKAWQQAIDEDKLVLVSIGYAACHWCHVMEHETFENEETAKIMNKNFVCIKVDREERPDIDQIYMDAVQLINGSGGWPLNAFCLPDKRPLHGGTYFRNSDWNNVLGQLNELYKTNKNTAIDYAEKLQKGMLEMDQQIVQTSKKNITDEDVLLMYENFSKHFDYQNGGMNRVPKFPMPVNYHFLLNFYQTFHKISALKFTEFSLHKIALAGIYDHLAGGFARYATDAKWHIPHFEKMLYDNAQLLTVLSQLYQITKDDFYKNIMAQTFDFCKTYLSNSEGGYFSSIDADSEGEEGKFYVWKKHEIENILKENSQNFCEIFQVSEEGNWEHGNNILDVISTKKDDLFSDEMVKMKQQLLTERNKRIAPGTDTKIILCWQSLMLSALCDSYMSTGEKSYFAEAISAKNFIDKNLLVDGELYRISKDGKTSVTAFSEDLACYVQACIKLYQCTFDEKILKEAEQISEFVLREFYDENKKLFYFTSKNQEEIIHRKIDTTDDVIPSSNAIMAINLYQLGALLGKEKYEIIADEMTNQLAEKTLQSPAWYSAWSMALLIKNKGLRQIVLTGKNALENAKEFYIKKNELTLIAATEMKSDLAIFENRINDTFQIYICEGKVCGLPLSDVNEAIKSL